MHRIWCTQWDALYEIKIMKCKRLDAYKDTEKYEQTMCED